MDALDGVRNVSHERIVAAVEKLGEALARHFPAGKGAANPNELADDVTED